MAVEECPISAGADRQFRLIEQATASCEHFQRQKRSSAAGVPRVGARRRPLSISFRGETPSINVIQPFGAARSMCLSCPQMRLRTRPKALRSSAAAAAASETTVSPALFKVFQMLCPMSRPW